MPIWKANDQANSKPLIPEIRSSRLVLSTTLAVNANTSATTLTLSSVNGVSNGMVVTGGANVLSIGGKAGYSANATATNVTRVTNINAVSNTITINAALPGALNIGNPILIEVGIPGNDPSLTNTVLMTRTRMANGLFANSNLALAKPVAHQGWVKLKTGTGNRAGRVQSEVMVALSTPVAANATSGTPYFTGV